VRYPIAAILLILPQPSHAADPSVGAACSISAYLTDRDPNGVNVRAGPSTGSAVLHVVGADIAGVAAIREHRRGWFGIAGIVDAESDSPVFQGRGWVHGSLLGLDVANADPRLYAAPRSDSRVVATLRAADTQVTLIGCAGPWAHVRAGGRTGWLSAEGQCSSPLTTCP
jgi:SH3-like domain-containing protein